MRNLITALETWYLEQCDGDWEHQYGVTIETPDNPGWHVKIDLVGTDVVATEFPKLAEDRSETDWIHVSSSDSLFSGLGGPRNLEEILRRFLDWVEEEAQEGLA